jgi:hypothetical protein
MRDFLEEYEFLSRRNKESKENHLEDDCDQVSEEDI